MEKIITIEIENPEGDGILAFQLDISGDEVKVINTLNCNLADIDNDNVFKTDTKLLRIQQD